ncbi:Gcd10p-domain-containing protein [Gloeophyllum trabeum ATCC 11539]|uniref:tRNA (adenine(58)-N(1))-methyltransferase non-catalytic subunit TRM6 n=1 Tax=Gloeophyllum trabeum (strain ATCC 11539 / FP-39264 / Madison 617) TaxID=670483 RepID=S7QLX4_GLOTA|nr:Gcd10p-domain-containing protein [Gloeophyllum trabeum ATCC 11539]EPQ60453.1 Gcd10p-domain-containing protein [Gloeophyllum trabeum ATCC 11539]
MQEGTSTLPLNTSRGLIQDGDTVLLRLPNGDVRSIKLEKDSTVNLGRVGSFNASDLFNHTYGLTYDISGKKLEVIPPRSIQEVEDTEATNELINDGEFVQPLTSEEIETLKKSGVPASEIIKRQIEQHANYSLKTEYSKEKYKKRKEAKYSKTFTTIEPTLFNVCEYWFKKDQSRLRDIRCDTLSQMLHLASVRPGGRYIVVDDASGILVAGVLDRLSGDGRVISICDVESSPAYPVLTQLNLKKEALSTVLSSLNWATADEEYIPMLAASGTSREVKSERQKVRASKRKAAGDSLVSVREELFDGEFDGLLVASEYDPLSIVEKLSPYLAGSASIVVQSPNIQVLADLQSQMRQIPHYLAPAVTEVWLRRYQVLPGRTHPFMNMSGSGGFLLHAIKM